MIDRVKSRRQIQERNSSKFTTVLSWQNIILNIQKSRFDGISTFICWLKVIRNTWILHVKFYLAMKVFFNSGVTWAILKVSGNFPSANERFMTIVTDPARISALSLTIWAEHRFRSHDLLGDDRISFDTFLSETYEKVSKGFGAAGGVGSGWMFESDLADSRVFLIFPSTGDDRQSFNTCLRRTSYRGCRPTHQCWPSVADGGPVLYQHWANVSCYLVFLAPG